MPQAVSQGRHKDTLKGAKDTGTCSVCWATFKIQRATGHVHRHVHRDSLCPGSDKLPINHPLTQSSSAATKHQTDTLSQAQDVQSLPSASVRGSVLWSLNLSAIATISLCLAKLASIFMLAALCWWAK